MIIKCFFRPGHGKLNVVMQSRSLGFICITFGLMINIALCLALKRTNGRVPFECKRRYVSVMENARTVVKYTRLNSIANDQDIESYGIQSG